MNLTYENYPMLLFFSYSFEDAIKEIPFEVESEGANKFIEQNYTLGELLTCIDILKNNGSGITPTYYLCTGLFAIKTKSSSTFSKRYYFDFFKSTIIPCTGIICVEPGFQYIYMLLGVSETNNLRGLDGRLIGVALFKGDTFIGVEEGVIKDNEIKILPTAYYPKDEGLIPGCFINFTIEFLSYINNKKDISTVDKNFNKTAETVFLVE